MCLHIDTHSTPVVDIAAQITQHLGIVRHQDMAKKTLPQLELLVEKYAQMTAREIEIALSKDRADADDNQAEDHDTDTCNAEDCPMDHSTKETKTSKTAKANYKRFTDKVNALWQDQGRLRELHSQAFNETYSVISVAERLARKHSR